MWRGWDIARLGAKVMPADSDAGTRGPSGETGEGGAGAHILGREEGKGRVRRKSRGSWLAHATRPHGR